MAKIIGLTGGIASGKSTVSNYLKAQGLAVVDADALVHAMQEVGGQLYKALVGYFGTAILSPDGRLDRPKLGQLLFANPDQMAASAALQDGIIREALARERDRFAASHAIVFLDIPLLFEKGYDSWCDAIWLLVVDEDTQLRRLMVRNGYSKAEALARIASQMPLSDKIPRADRLIGNSGQLAETFAQVDQYLEELKGDKR